jgi:CHASE2 domain-containing sensor protein
MHMALLRLAPRTRLVAAVALAAGLLAVASYASGALDGLQRSTIDARFALRGAEAPGHHIVIVAVDAQTLASINVRSLIPRLYYARLIDRLHAASARLVAVDVQFIGMSDRADDRALLGAIARDRPVLLATHDAANGPIPVPAGVREASGAVLASAAVDPDHDNVLRRMLYAPVAMPTFAVKAAELVSGKPVSQQDFPDNHAWIDFVGPPGTFPTYSLADVLSGKTPSSVFAGKIVLVGVTDPLGRDVFVTSASSTPMAGVEVDANALQTILDGFPLKSAWRAIEILLLLALAALPALLSIRFSVLAALAGALVVLLAFLAGAQLAFDGGTIVDVPDAILALALGSAGAVAAESFMERRYRRALEEALGPLEGEQSHFFLSYRRDQSRWAAQMFYSELVTRFGRSSVFMDRGSIDAGQIWPRRIEKAIDDCRVMLVLIGPEWSDARDANGTRRLDDPDDWVRREVAAGLARDETVVVPVLLDGAIMPAQEQLPSPLQGLVDCNAMPVVGDDLESEIPLLVASIQKGRIRDYLARERLSAG